MLAIGYYGGKSPRRLVGRWIAGLLPCDRRVHYMEPFAGMAGVLLCRPQSFIETLNDSNRWIINWWTCVRERHDELARHISLVPRSRAIFDDSLRLLQQHGVVFDMPNLPLAVAAHVVLDQSFKHALGPGQAHWGRYLGLTARVQSSKNIDFGRLAARIRDVQFECRDACELIEWAGPLRESVIYCDPPYRTTRCEPYGVTCDWDRLSAALLAARGRCAISGVEGEWDHLGWRLETMERNVGMGRIRSTSPHAGQEAVTMNEHLWLNYEPEDTPPLLDELDCA